MAKRAKSRRVTEGAFEHDFDIVYAGITLTPEQERRLADPVQGPKIKDAMRRETGRYLAERMSAAVTRWSVDQWLARPRRS